MNTIDEILTMWDQAGDRPYEVLIEYGKYDLFIAYLNQQSINLDGNIYRGTRRHHDLHIGNELSYTYPTSWSLERDKANNFVDGVDHPVILVLSSTTPIKAIYNDQNSYNELEMILHPIKLIIKNKTIITIVNHDVTILEVQPII